MTGPVGVRGGSESERIKLRLEVAVELCLSHLLPYLFPRCSHLLPTLQLGSYHTLELDLQRAFTLTKDVWDSVAIDRLKEACDPSANADLAVVVMQEGLANVCLIGGSVTTVKARIETPIPRKRGPAIAGYDKAINKFFENVFQGVQRHIDFNIIRCLLIASPGFTKDQFFEYMMLEATRQNIRAIIENKAKIVLAHSTSGYKHAVKEVLALPAIMTQIKDTKAAKEVKALEDFYAMLSNDSARAFYGPGHVEAANERLAIHTLLISDDLFRNADVKTRRRYVDLVESVRANGGQVHVFSSLRVLPPSLTHSPLSRPTTITTPTIFHSNADVKTRRRYVDLVESVRANGGQVHVFSSLHVTVSPPLPTPVHPLFHSNADVKTRRRYVDLVESVRANGGQVHVFSSLHLVNLAGIAEILRFPLPELEDMEL
ncbi:unnamed protein product [Closterium sp. Naga37s-1]|nr:unnamed protein product [Closterium sp. Naga37s-1]